MRYTILLSLYLFSVVTVKLNMDYNPEFYNSSISNRMRLVAVYCPIINTTIVASIVVLLLLDKIQRKLNRRR